MRADVTGDGKADLVVAYSRLNHVSAAGFSMKYFRAAQAFLMIALPDGTRISARINGVRAVTIVAVGHVNSDPGSEIFLQTFHTSSGSVAAAYGLSHARLVPAGATLAYGGDSGNQAGFDCVTADKPELVQRIFLLGATSAWESETAVTYSWRGPKLVQIAKRTFKRRGYPMRNMITVGRGCGPVS